MLSNSNQITFINKENEMEIKDFLLRNYISNRLYRNLYQNKRIYINGKPLTKDFIVKQNDVVTIVFDDEISDIEPQKMDLDIVYEDEDLIVVNKPPFILVHPTKNYPDNTLSNGIAFYFKQNNLKRKIRIVNRLDRDTSGLVIFAKNQFAHQQMALQLEDGRLEKYYYAIVQGIVGSDEGTIEQPIAQKLDSYGRETREDGDYAKTYYKVLERLDDITLLKVKTFTGRTHQIRVHLDFIGHPIIGDTLYHQKNAFINRQALHASSLIFYQIRTKNKIKIGTELPDDMKLLLKQYKSVFIEN
ncbi:RluA family pseudouridine synthase [Soehngenia saccharolytica]|nr:RluA family pseudouridine synthase [Soehngenia saccharolytica]